jgi:hypothetical protein
MKSPQRRLVRVERIGLRGAELDVSSRGREGAEAGATRDDAERHVDRSALDLADPHAAVLRIGAEGDGDVGVQRDVALDDHDVTADPHREIAVIEEALQLVTKDAPRIVGA